jgi:hypothetical protein
MEFRVHKKHNYITFNDSSLFECTLVYQDMAVKNS